MSQFSIKKYCVWLIVLLLTACQAAPVQTPPEEKNRQKTIVVSTAILGSLVQELTGDSFHLEVLMPNGQDPHNWEPSAKNIESLHKADLIVINGLGLEAGIHNALEEAKTSGIPVFTAADYITPLPLAEGDHHHGHEATESAAGEATGDPHFWTDPTRMIPILQALSGQIQSQFAVNLTQQNLDLQDRLTRLDAEVQKTVHQLPPNQRKLITGHQSMAYFAKRYGFEQIGTIIPSASSQAEVSAFNLADLKSVILQNQVKAIFCEAGTSTATAETIAQETGARVISLPTHILPDDGSYFTFIRHLTSLIVDSLR